MDTDRIADKIARKMEGSSVAEKLAQKVADNEKKYKDFVSKVGATAKAMRVDTQRAVSLLEKELKSAEFEDVFDVMQVFYKNKTYLGDLSSNLSRIIEENGLDPVVRGARPPSHVVTEY